MERLRILLSGRVQGVGFRWYARDAAEASGELAGWVRNLPDGRVEIVAEGEAGVLADYLAALQRGRLGRNIAGVETFAERATGSLREFTIRF